MRVVGSKVLLGVFLCGKPALVVWLRTSGRQLSSQKHTHTQGFRCDVRKSLPAFSCFAAMVFRPAAVFAYFLFGIAGASPQVINAEFDSAPQAFDHRLSNGNFRQRALRLTQRLDEAEEQLLRLKAQSAAGHQSAASLFSLQPVDAERVANGIAATEPMLGPNGWTINVSEENRGPKNVERHG